MSRRCHHRRCFLFVAVRIAQSATSLQKSLKTVDSGAMRPSGAARHCPLKSVCRYTSATNASMEKTHLGILRFLEKNNV